MNSVTENLVKKYEARLAVLVYATDENFTDCYLESHVMSGGKVMAGKPLKQETIEGIVDVFFDEQQTRAKINGFIPENLLQFVSLPGGHFKMVWYRQEQRRVLHFEDSLKIPSGEAWIPPTVWVADNKQLRIYALKSSSRPDPETDLFRAPFHNVGDGLVCLGNAKVAKPTEKTYLAVMKYWEDMFWLSVFTHISGNSPTKTNVNMLWKRLIKDKKLKWDTLDELLPVRKKEAFKLKNILK